MALTGRLVAERNLTTLMVTHSMQDAIRYGNRLIMMHAGRIILDIRDDAKGGAHGRRAGGALSRGGSRLVGGPGAAGNLNALGSWSEANNDEANNDNERIT